MSKLPKDGFPAASKGFDMRDIESDYAAAQAKKKPSKSDKLYERFKVALKKLPPVTSDKHPDAEAAKPK